jgi:hypothetical protein
MYQLSGSTQAALDYNSTIIGALELVTSVNVV